MNEFAGKVVLITGGAKGQGRNHALRLAEEGAKIAICDICDQFPTAAPMASQEQLQATADEIRALGTECLAVVADTRDPAAMRDFVGQAVEKWGKVDVFIANAGIASFGPVAEMADDMWDETIDTNLGGVVNSIRAVVPVMKQQRTGRIIATSSSVAREGGPNNANYAAAKWGVIGFVKSLAMELAPTGVTVNALAPMSVSTDMCHNERTYGLFRPDLAAPTADDVKDTFGTLNPMGVPWLEVDDVTAAVRYLASDSGRYVTGAVMEIAAGWNAKHCA